MGSISDSVVTNVPEISANLPGDIICHIFIRLPVKSIARFKCLSQSFNALLGSPVFAKMHLQRTALKNPNLVLKLDNKLFSVDDEEWDRCRCRTLRLPFTSSLEKVEISGSCNGLLCISDQQCNEDIFLYNPSTGMNRKLPFPDFDLPTIESSCFTTVGFGYHEAEDDYKVIRCVYFYDKPFVNIDSYQCEARVYSVTTNKWKKIGHIPFHLGYRAAVWLGNEFLVWKASRGIGLRVSFLVISYDMNKEVFKEIPQPEVSYSRGTQMEVGVLGGHLSIFYLGRNDGACIWTMKNYGVKDSWTLTFAIERPEIVGECYMFLKPLVMLHNGEILIEAGERTRVLYDPKNKTFRVVNIQGAPRRSLVATNVGSLVSPFNCRAGQQLREQEAANW